MGGNALETPIRRYQAAEFRELEAEVMSLLPQCFGEHRQYAPLLYYKFKASFGDLDIVITEPRLPREEIISRITEVFGSPEVVIAAKPPRPQYVSFWYKEFQIDLIFTPEDCFETTCSYLAYNDLNNLVGVYARKMGFSLGSTGLLIHKSRFLNSAPGSLTLSKDPEKIHRFFGLNYSRFLKGFDTLEEIFRYVTSSPYFDPELFAYENLDHKNRLRNRKRKTYGGFLTYIMGKYFSSPIPDPTFEEVDAFFPEANLLSEVRALEAAEERRLANAALLNGNVMMQAVPQLQQYPHLIGTIKDEIERYTTGVETYTVEDVQTATIMYWEEVFKV